MNGKFYHPVQNMKFSTPKMRYPPESQTIPPNKVVHVFAHV